MSGDKEFYEARRRDRDAKANRTVVRPYRSQSHEKKKEKEKKKTETVLFLQAHVRSHHKIFVLKVK